MKIVITVHTSLLKINSFPFPFPFSLNSLMPCAHTKNWSVYLCPVEAMLHHIMWMRCLATQTILYLPPQITTTGWIISWTNWTALQTWLWITSSVFGLIKKWGEFFRFHGICAIAMVCADRELLLKEWFIQTFIIKWAKVSRCEWNCIGNGFEPFRSRST